MTAIDGRPRGKDQPVGFAELTKDCPWPPTLNGMPPLPYDDFPDTLLAQYIAAARPLEGEYHAIAVKLARLADKAVSEYRAAKECFDGYFRTTGVDSIEGHTLLLRATSFMENCIDAIVRAETHYSTGALASITTDSQRRLLRDLHQGVRDVRNSIQHANERLAEGRIPEGDPLFPAMTSDCVYFAGEYLFYGEIASLVMHVWYLGFIGVKAAQTADDADV